MEETYVRLLCPDCEKGWQSAPGELPAVDESHECPDCRSRRRTSEFTRTEHDLRTLKQFG